MPKQECLPMTSSQTRHAGVFPRKILFVGTKTGKCDICKQTKKVLLLKYGFTLCEECLSICTSILEEVQSNTPNKHTKTKRDTETQKIRDVKEPKKSKRAAQSAKSEHLLEPEASGLSLEPV